MHLYDLPHLYDALNTRGTAGELDGIERAAWRHLATARPPLPRSRQLWLEPACGTGRYLRLVARRGRHVVGFDQSAPSVAYARATLRARGLQRRARLFVGEMTCFLPQVGRARVDVAFNPVNTIRHLQNDAAVLAHLRQIEQALRPGGVYVVGMSLSRYGREAPEEDVWMAVRGRMRVQQVVQYLPPAGPGGRERWERVFSHLMVTRPRGVEHLDDAWRLRCYDLAQWQRMVDRSRLQLVEVCDAHGDPCDRQDAPYYLFVLRRAPG